MGLYIDIDGSTQVWINKKSAASDIFRCCSDWKALWPKFFAISLWHNFFFCCNWRRNIEHLLFLKQCLDGYKVTTPSLRRKFGSRNCETFISGVQIAPYAKKCVGFLSISFFAPLNFATVGFPLSVMSHCFPQVQIRLGGVRLTSRPGPNFHLTKICQSLAAENSFGFVPSAWKSG